MFNKFNRVNNLLITSCTDLVTFEAICLVLYRLKIHYFIEFEVFKNFTIYYIAADISDEKEKEVNRIIKDYLKAKHLIE